MIVSSNSRGLEEWSR
uniref:AtRLP19 (Receptor Like Protein 19) n=1 Tax=Arundo donax TaxID=35708 RepID=A0A0A8Z6E2_ARUDO